MAFMALRAYARGRGVRLSAVQKAIESRRVHGAAIREEGGRITGIDPELADQQWARNTDPVEAARSGTGVQAPSQPPPAAGAADKPAAPAEPTGDQGNFLAARVKEAELRGELLELDKFERLGMLMPRSVVEREFSEIFAQLKSATFRIPDRIAQSLAGEADPLRINRVLSEELRTVFNEFSRRICEPAAGVADDAAMAGEREKVLP
jgi:hypothetical protein